MTIHKSQKAEKIYYDKNVIENFIEKIKKEEIHVLTDFDKTLTEGNSESSWSWITHSGLMSDEYVNERKNLYSIYRPIEINMSLPEDERKEKMKEWWEAHLLLFKKYCLNEDVVKTVIRNPQLMKLRKGATQFLKACKEKDIPIIIISAGIGNFIEEFLNYYGLLSDNVKIISNFIYFKNGIAEGFSQNIIHATNKDESDLPDSIKELIQNRPYTLVLGDSIDDIKMVSLENLNKALKVGFVEENIEENLPYFREKFDIVCADNCSFATINELMGKIR